jgi:hypothetical protein
MGPEKCPFCGQEIDSDAARCFFCGAELDEEDVEQRLEQLEIEDSKTTRRKKFPLVLWIVVFVLICIVLFSGASVKRSKSTKAISSGESTIRLNAAVTFTGTQFIIYNRDSFDWTNVALRITREAISSDYNISMPIITAGEKRTVRASEFSDKDGSFFNPYTMKPHRFQIQCDTETGKNGTYSAVWDQPR